MPDEFVAFDLETTGLSVKSDRIIEVGAVRFDRHGHILGELEMLVDPGIAIPLAIQRLVGIDNAAVQGAPSPAEAVAQLLDFTAGATVVAHGAQFDLGYCRNVISDAFVQQVVFDTLELARLLLPTAASHSLPLLSTALGIVHDHPHRALSDADATRALLVHLLEVAANLPTAILHRIRSLVDPLPGGLREFFVNSVQGDGAAGAEVAAPVASPPRPLRVPRDEADIGAAALALLGPDGPLAGPDYEYREGQMQMTTAVAQTLQRSRHLIVEAGTGIGKSYAYLAPLLLHSIATGQRGTVATHTITLQEQLVDRDIPKLVAALDEPVNVAMLKGRHHYLSLRRWQRFLRNVGSDVDRVHFAIKLMVWLSATRRGDRGELRLAAVEDALWRQVRSESDDCLGGACANWRSGACYMVAARRAASQADLVVTNHALLLATVEMQGQVMSDIGALVVDEAHRLEESATSQLGGRLRLSDLTEPLSRLEVRGGSETAAAIAAASAAVRRLFGDAKGTVSSALGQDTAANGTVAWGEKLRESHAGELLARTAATTVRALHEAALALRRDGSDGFDSSVLAQPELDIEEADAVAGALDTAANNIDQVLGAPRDGYVSWLEVRAEQAELHFAPVSVAEQLRRSLFDDANAVVLTSATLSVAGDFSFTSQRLGLGAGAETLSLPSPFDYLAQAVSVLPTDMPPYDEPGYDERLAELIADVAIRLGGGTLALFTGYQSLRRVHGLLDRRLKGGGIAVLGQGLDGTRRQVLASFIANPRTVLLGTTSFWEGIDIPGDALRCVVIAKLPFAVPTDPLVRARSDMLGDPFRGYILPSAVLRLKQGFGRLIRRRSDRGAVIIGDARLGSHNYAAAFLEALPPAALLRLPSAEIAAAVADFIRNGELPAEATLAGLTTDGGQSYDGHDPHAHSLAEIDAADPHPEEPA